eukprot:scaffold18781_cov103-Isochrysis_galbana.AAC.3
MAETITCVRLCCRCPGAWISPRSPPPTHHGPVFIPPRPRSPAGVGATGAAAAPERRPAGVGWLLPRSDIVEEERRRSPKGGRLRRNGKISDEISRNTVEDARLDVETGDVSVETGDVSVEFPIAAKM